MKKIHIGIIGYSKLWIRIIDIVQSECLKNLDFNIMAYEDEEYISSYRYTAKTRDMWEDNIKYIKQGLIENLSRIEGRIYPINNEYTWLKPRELNRGDLSVMAKHKRIMENFVSSSYDYVLILEDDAIIKNNALTKIQELIDILPVDYIDLAGGDNIKTNQSNLSKIKSIFVEKISNGATRTACAYILSRNAAEAAIETLKYPCMPIDWSISLALSKNKSFDCYWIHDSLIEHGSCTGKVVSWRKSLE